MPRMQTAAPSVYVAPSGIHGSGLFAAVEIPKDTLILRAVGEPITEDDPHAIWWVDDAGVERGIRITNDARFVNHAKEATAAFFDLELWSLRRIPRGTEITHDYGEGWA